jgi:AcrR family transcriptional regulator
MSLEVKSDTGHTGRVAERWTPERRRQHTRDLLMDAAQQVFARRGFEGASLEEIAQTAGYTRGAIYKNFGSKEELFLAVNRRYNERFLETFAFPEGANLATTDLAVIARQWREMLERDGPESMAMFLEFQLYLLRNPEARERLADQRRQFTEMVAGFIDEQSRHLGVSWRIPVTTVARLVLATADGIHLADYLDPSEEDLYLPFLEALLSRWAEGSGQVGRAAPG